MLRTISAHHRRVVTRRPQPRLLAAADAPGGRHARGRRATGYTVSDPQLGKRFELPLDVLNLFDHDYPEARFATDARLACEPELVSDLSFTPGHPPTAIGSISSAF
jgi:hypothetical protein